MQFSCPFAMPVLLLGLLGVFAQAQPQREGRSGQGSPEWGTRGGGRRGGHGPPQESIDACTDLQTENACNFVNHRGHEVSGNCREMRRGPNKGTLHCRPNGGRGGRDGGRGRGNDDSNRGQGGRSEGGRGDSGQQGAATGPAFINSSIASCEGKEAEDPCMVRPPVMGDQEARGFQGGSQRGNMRGGDRREGRGWDERSRTYMQRRAPPRAARPERPGICVPVMQRSGRTVNFCRPLPPAEAMPVCEDLNVNDTCSFTTNGSQTYVELKVYTGNQSMAETDGSILASFFIEGEWTDPELFFTGAQQGESKSKVFVLPGWPSDVSLSIWSNDAWCFWKIMVNDTVILEDPKGPTGSDRYYKENDTSTYADSPYWIEGPPSSQMFDVPPSIEASRRLSQDVDLRIFTATSEHAPTKGEVFVDFLVRGEWIRPESMFVGAVTGEEKSRTFTLDAWPEKVWIGINSSDAYSYWKITINNQAVIEDPAGSAGSHEYDAMGSLATPSQFWIESPPASQSFSIPQDPRYMTRPDSRRHQIEGTCQESWWDMLNGTLFCRPAWARLPFQPQMGSAAPGPDATRPNNMQPDFNVKSTDIEESSEAVKLVMVVKNINYDKLVLDGEMKATFAQVVQRAIAHEAGQGVYPMDVEVALSPGSVVITAHVDPPAYISRPYLQKKLVGSSLAQHVGVAIAGIPNIETISSGAIVVSDPEVEIVMKATGLPASAQDDDNHDTEMLMIAAASSAGLAICMCIVSLCMWRKLRAAKMMEVDINGTTVAIGRPVPPSETNHVTVGTPVDSVPADEKKGEMSLKEEAWKA